MAQRYLIIDVIGLKQENNTYRNASLTCTVSCGGKKIGDLSLARKDHQLQIPVSSTKDRVQFNIFPMTNPSKRVGSVSISVEGLIQFPLNERHEQYFTLFDFIEDDLYDGAMGVDDEELPMVQLRYHVTDSPLSRTSYENRKEETVVTTKTITKKETAASPAPAPSTTSSEPVVRDANLESSDAYSVKTLTTDLRNGLNQLVDELKAEQSDIFNYENARADQLAHLEKVHKELEQEHINDQVCGEELKRLEKEITSEISIAKSGFEDDKQSLARSIAHTDEQLSEKDPLLKAKQETNGELNKTLSQDEKSVYHTPQAATDLRKSNDDARKRMEDAAASVRKEREEKAAVFNQYADLVNQYNDLVARYKKLLLDAETARRDAERDANGANEEISTESAEGTNLEHYIEVTNKNSYLKYEILKFLYYIIIVIHKCNNIFRVIKQSFYSIKIFWLYYTLSLIHLLSFLTIVFFIFINFIIKL